MSSEEASGGRDKEEVRLGNQSENKVINGGHIMSGGMFLEIERTDCLG